MMGEIVTRNTWSYPLRRIKTQLLHLVGLISLLGSMCLCMLLYATTLFYLVCPDVLNLVGDPLSVNMFSSPNQI